MAARVMRKLLVLLLGLVCAGFAFTATAGDAIPSGQLPAEARAMLDLIDRGGPFPYRRDGIVRRGGEGKAGTCQKQQDKPFAHHASYLWSTNLNLGFHFLPQADMQFA